MKKLLSMLGAIGLVATSSASVVACGSKAGDSDTSGPSKDDVAKWDAMEIKDFEKLFEDTIAMMTDTDSDENNSEDFMAFSIMLYRISLIIDANGEKQAAWNAKDTKKFEVLFNRIWSNENYNLLNSGIDIIKTKDESYDFFADFDHETKGLVLSSVKEWLDLIEDNKSPVKDIRSLSKWNELINKAKDR